MDRSSAIARDCLIWLFGTVLLPLGLIAFLILVKGAAFDSTVSGGELVATGTSIAGASIAIEMIVYPGAVLTSVYRLGLLSVLLGNTLFFAGTAQVERSEVVTNLNPNQIKVSAVLMVMSAIFGVATVARQTFHLHYHSRP